MTSNNICVMVSGGIDSLIAYHYGVHQNIGKDGKVYPMFVDVGQPYVAKEIKACEEQYGSNLIKVKADLCTKELDNIPTLEKQEIYGRNLLLAFYGANLGDKVWLAALQTEMNPTAVRDKHPEFFLMSSALLTYVFKSKRFSTVVETPFAENTKTDIIRMALNAGWLTKKQLSDTTSCYNEEHKSCGYCSTCFKRWVAFCNNEIEDDWFKHPYNDNEYGQKIVESMREEIKTGKYSGRFSNQRIIETNHALLTQGFKGVF